MNNTVAAVLAADLGFLPVAVSFMKLLGQELKKFVSILLFRCHKILEGLLLADPEARQDIGRSVAVRVLKGVKVLEHVVHCAAETVWDLAVGTLVTITEVEVSQERVMQEALQHDVLVAGRTSIVDAAQTIRSARRCRRVVCDVFGIILHSIREQFLMLAFST